MKKVPENIIHSHSNEYTVINIRFCYGSECGSENQMRSFALIITLISPRLHDKTEFTGVRTPVGEPGSSVSIVSGYGLDDRAIKVRSPPEAKGFFL
jgi:hypothetical protein